jgi:TonB family protein
MTKNRTLSVANPRCATAIALILLFPTPTTVVAQENAPTTELERVVEPVAIHRSAPAYPNRELYRGLEGWVSVSYIVSETGEVKEAMIEDSSGNEGLEDAALAAVREWRYEPATINGKPVEQSITNSVIRFQIDGANGASREFIASFKEIQSLLAAKDLAKAQELLTDLRDKGRRNLYEDAWFWWLQFMYLDLTNGDAEERRDALAKAIGYEEMYLPADLFVSASAKLFVLRVQAGDLGGALDAYERLTSSKAARRGKGYSEVQPQLESAVRKIELAAAGETVLSLRGRVGAHDYWVHALLRRSFSLGKIEGSLEHLSIRCSRRSVTFTPVTGEHTWTVPAGYGDCSVYLKGMPGATFEFYEYPTPAPTPSIGSDDPAFVPSRDATTR